MASYKLTIRHGSKVTRESHETLAGALEALRESSQRIRAEGNLPEASMIRTYEPGERVKARLEISTGGFLRRRDAGLDVMGDGALVPFQGGVVRRPLETENRSSPFEAIEASLRSDGR